jgi:hypothetical protein
MLSSSERSDVFEAACRWRYTTPVPIIDDFRPAARRDRATRFLNDGLTVWVFRLRLAPFTLRAATAGRTSPPVTQVGPAAAICSLLSQQA